MVSNLNAATQFFWRDFRNFWRNSVDYLIASVGVDLELQI